MCPTSSWLLVIVATAIVVALSIRLARVLVPDEQPIKHEAEEVHVRVMRAIDIELPEKLELHEVPEFPMKEEDE